MALLLFCGTGFFASSSVQMAVPLFGLALLLGLLWAAKLFLIEAVSWKKNLMHIPVAAFALYALLRYCTSPIEYVSRLELFQVAICTLIYFAAACNFYHRHDRTILLGMVVLLGLAETGLGIWQFATKAQSIFGLERPSMYFHRAGGTFFCPNHLAGFLEMVICLVVARLAIHSSSKLSLEKLALRKVMLLFVALILGVGLLATLSRGGFISLIIGLAVLLPLGGNRWGLWGRLAVVVIGISGLTLLAFKSEALNSRLLPTYYMVRGPEGQSVNLHVGTLGSRIEVWKATVKLIQGHPIWGTGAATWEWFYRQVRPEKSVGNPQLVHNDYLNLLSDYGFVGFALIGLAITCFFGHAYRISRGLNSPEERAFAVGSAMAVGAILAHSFVDFNLHIPANSVLFMALMGFTVAIDVQPREAERIVMRGLVRYSLAAGLILACGVTGWFFGRTALADRYQRIGDLAQMAAPEAAVSFYKRAIALGANNPHPYIGIGDTYYTQSFWRKVGSHKAERVPLARQAAEWYEKALLTNPYDGAVFVKLLRTYDMIDDGPELIKAADRAIAVDPLNPSIYFLLGSYYLRNNDIERAKPILEKARDYSWGYNAPGAWLKLQDIESMKKPQ